MKALFIILCGVPLVLGLNNRARAAAFTETDWALTGSASQSSDLDPAHGAALAIDGNTDGAWASNSDTHTTNADDPPWWEVDLGAVKPIARIAVWFRTDCCQNRNDDFTLIVMDANRTELWKRTYPGRPPLTVYYDLVPTIQGEIVRIEGQTPRTTGDGYLSLAEVQVIAPYTGVTLTVTQNPANTTVYENQPATLGPVAAVPSDTNVPPSKVAIQWQKNGTNIPFANLPTFTTPPEPLSDNGAKFSALFLLPGVSVSSSNAVLTVLPDTGPPVVASVGAEQGFPVLHLLLNFNKLMNASTVTNLTNYTFGGSGISVTGATMSGTKTDTNNNTVFNSAILQVVGLPANTNYSLTVSGLKDLSGNLMVTTNLTGISPFYDINYAPAGTATQSSDLDAVHVASLGIDGNTDGNWNDNSVLHTSNANDPPWWQVDLGSVKTLGAVSVWFRTDAGHIKSRDDDFTTIVLDAQQKEVFRRTYPGRPPSNVPYNFDPPIQGQVVRIEGQTPRTTSDGYMTLAEVQAIAPYQNVTLAVGQGPADVTAVQSGTATFGPVSPNVVGAPPEKVSYQWQKNSVDIPGAFGTNYTTPLLTLADDKSKFAVKMLLPGFSVLSQPATLTVTNDITAPKVVAVDSVVSGGTGTFFITYSELMDPATATNTANYAFGSGVQVNDGSLDATGRTVALGVQGLGSATTYAIDVSNAQDLAGNKVAPTHLTGTIETDYAMTGTASQSSDLDGIHVAALANDGNTDGNFGHGSVTHTANTDDPPVWEVDLGSVKSIGQIHVWFRTDCCQGRDINFTTYVLDANHGKLWSVTYPGNPGNDAVYNFAPAVQGRYVRIEGAPKPVGDDYLALAEVQVFNPLATEKINITQGPTNITAVAGQTAKFGPVTVDTSVPPQKITYQWQKNGTNITGAIFSSYTTPPLSSTDNGARYTVTAFISGSSATSTPATLTVTAGANPSLAIARVGNNVEISWPTSATGFTPESSDTIVSGTWTVVSDPVLTRGDQSYISVTTSGTTKFYRLAKR